MLDTGPPGLNPITVAWNTVARFDDYESVQRAVDRLSDDGFPVDQLDIIGGDVRLIERVTGRLSTALAGVTGAVGGLWLGLIIGGIAALVTGTASWFAFIAVAAGVGAAWGALLGSVAHAARRGRRDFRTARGLLAGHYDLIARGGSADRARRMLSEAGLLPIVVTPPPADSPG